MTSINLKSSGFTLLEVVIAAAILAIGLLGLASLQAVSLKNSNNSMIRAQAVNLAYSIVDAIRANSGSASAYDGTAMEEDTVCNQSDGIVNISGNSVASQDISAWRVGLACALPLGTGSIDINGSTVTVTVRWDISRTLTEQEISNAVPTTQTFIMVTSL